MSIALSTLSSSNYSKTVSKTALSTEGRRTHHHIMH